MFRVQGAQGRRGVPQGPSSRGLQRFCVFLRGFCGFLVPNMFSMAAAGGLEEGFRSPPPGARPQVVYTIMNGNATKEGLTLDFEAMAEAGIGGMQIFDVGCDVPAGALEFNTPEWFDLMRHAHCEAKRLGLAMGVANCSGWSASGGPWVKPEDAMKVVVAAETSVKGPARFSGVLARTKNDNGFYEDIAVLAYPTPEKGAWIADLPAKCGKVRKTGFKRQPKAFAPEKVVAKDAIRDLSGRMAPDGTLKWDVPEGDWTILRVGFVCNGKKNHPATKNGRGLEVDKFSEGALGRHFEGYAGRLCREFGVSAATDNRTGFGNVHVDSWEVGCQNWTRGLEGEFEKRAGYPITPYLPVFAGRVVGSVEETERFLASFRRVLAELFEERHVRALARLCHENGLTLSAEPYGNSNADNIAFARELDEPMGCFWAKGTCGSGWDFDNTHAVAAAAHVLGKRIVAVEACTSGPPGGGRWLETPYSVKADCDRSFAAGGNRFCFHRYAHQPWTAPPRLPGMTMGRWGMHLERTQTWWPYAKGFFEYVARCQWMLQEGKGAADVLYWCGDASPNDGTAKVSLPAGFDYDICDTKALEAMRCAGGRLVAPSGAEYRLLVLPKGARRPAACKEDWPCAVSGNESTALKSLGVAPDCVCGADDFHWIHRKNDAADWYFVACGNKEECEIEVSFRQHGRAPQIWNAETGEIADAAEWRAEGERTVVRLRLPPKGSAFVVFGNKKARKRMPERGAAVASPVPGPWRVAFPVDWYSGGDAVKSVVMTNLADWTSFDDADVKYFSGTATYKTRVKRKGSKRGAAERVELDLGEVRDFAEVKANGKRLPPLWRPPFRLDITDAVGDAETIDLEIKVSNLWPNRLIGDDALCADDCKWRSFYVKWTKSTDTAIVEIPQWVKDGKPSPVGRRTFTTWKHWTKDDALLPSGLLGPVTLRVHRDNIHN